MEDKTRLEFSEGVPAFVRPNKPCKAWSATAKSNQTGTGRNNGDKNKISDLSVHDLCFLPQEAMIALCVLSCSVCQHFVFSLGSLCLFF